MPAGEQLQVMVKNLRAEVGHSLSTAQGVNSVDTLKYMLQRTQEELWTAFQWPELVLRVDTLLLAGQYLYNFPATMTFEQIRSAWRSYSGDTSWTELGYGIDEDKISPGGANSWRSDPIQVWDVDAGGQFRVWPTPDKATGAYIRFKGNKPLSVFVADADTCTLDDNLIVLFAAAEILARAKAEDAANKMQKAQRHLQKLLGAKISAKMRVSTLGGGSPDYKNRNTDNLSYSSTHWNQ